MVSHKRPQIQLSSDVLEAAIDSRGTARDLWQRIYAIGDEFACRGENLSLRLKTILNAKDMPNTEQDLEIYHLYYLAEQEAITQTRLEDMQQNFLIDFENADIGVMRISIFQRRMACLRAQVDLFGDRTAIEKHAQLSGFAKEVEDRLDMIEADIGGLTQQMEVIGPMFDVASRDFRSRIERGELVNDPLRGWIDHSHLRSIGGRTRITDFSTPVSHGEIADKSCPVCLEAFTSARQAVRLTACSHIIDAVCLDSWVNSIANKCNACVLCRQELFTRRPREPTGYLEWFSNLESQHAELEKQIEGLRADAQYLVEIMEEIQPSRVTRSIGGKAYITPFSQLS